MTTTIAFAQEHWDALRSQLNAPVESAWMAIARNVMNADGEDVTMLVRKVIRAPDDAYLERTKTRLVLGPAGWLPAFADADRDGSVPIFIHSHPAGDAGHSQLDFALDEELARVASVRSGLGAYGSLVVGGTKDHPSFSARLRLTGGDWRDVDRVRVVGEKLSIIASEQSEAPLPQFDRQVRAFGEQGQQVLQALRVGVVGAGGTGSAVIEQLARLGVRDITVVDPDVLEGTNVTRVFGSGIHDDGKPKVDVAEANAEKIGLGTAVTARRGTVLEREVALSLVHCDIVVGCTDDNAGRMLLTRLPHTLLQLFIDCGVVIDSREGALFEIFARVSIVTPMTACLVCMDDIDLEAARLETMSPEDRQGLIAEGYAPELDTTAPSVVTFTSLTASLAVNEMLCRALGYSEEEPANHLVARIANRSIGKKRHHVRGSHRCGELRSLGAGIREPLLDWWHDA